MKEEKINKLIEQFSNNEVNYEILNTTVNIDGCDIKICDLMKSSYKKGLEVNFENDVKELYKFSYNPQFKSDGLFGSYYIVVHYFADRPELCYYNGNVLKNQEGILIRKDEVIGAIKVDIPYEAIKSLEKWRELNHKEVTLNEIANHIVFHTYDKEDEEYDYYLRLKRKYEGLEE